MLAWQVSVWTCLASTLAAVHVANMSVRDMQIIDAAAALLLVSDISGLRRQADERYNPIPSSQAFTAYFIAACRPSGGGGACYLVDARISCSGRTLTSQPDSSERHRRPGLRYPNPH